MVQRYVVVGVGSIGRRHAANLKRLDPTAEVAIVSASGRPIDPADAAADAVLQSIGEAVAYAPHFAVIASPATHHLAHALPLLDAGIPVLIEKPLAAGLGACTDEIDRLRRHAGRLGVAYTLRHLPSAKVVQDLVASGRLGRIYGVQASVGQYLPDWRPASDYRAGVTAQRRLGGGAILELSHEVDYLNWLVGPFTRVYCHAVNTGSLDIDVEDWVDAVLTRSDGLSATVHLDLLQRTASRSCTIIGEHGTVVWNLRANRVELMLPAGRTEVVHDNPGYDRNEMYVAQLRHFVEVASGRARPVVDLEQGIAVMRILDAMRRSASLCAIIEPEAGTT